MKRLALTLAALLAPALAGAQTLQCSAPAQVERPRPDSPSPQQPRRVLPIGSYTLAITWSPEYCRTRRDSARDGFQCGGDNRFGFTLHGLWPDGTGKTWPQYCSAAPILPQAVIRQNLCVTPSAQLLQHEYAKHGTCMGVTPIAYFNESRALFQRLRFPDMMALSRRPGLTAGQLASAIARANPGITADSMRITTNQRGWLDEVWLCLDSRRRFARCPAHQGGVTPNTPIKIWRGGRDAG
ncbi:ribonuclease T2 family protein [Sphingomonas sp. Leaf25]|uniref:ribonuclease T2 family protein n=1 Tax=Sphingomonas sp. Leaf25 TaxID=1735692 RepID=UPI0006F4118C|nr:ribonuclease T2 [Sphingomonas sp. Leaf25]KQM97625.1 ribonuclease T [Sphingomonas sp. Leaf25]